MPLRDEIGLGALITITSGVMVFDSALTSRSHTGDFEETGDRDQPAAHRIHGKQELLERDHAEDWLGARLAEHDDRWLLPPSNPDLRPRHGVAYLASVSQHERPFLPRTTPSPSRTSRGTHVYGTLTRR